MDWYNYDLSHYPPMAANVAEWLVAMIPEFQEYGNPGTRAWLRIVTVACEGKDLAALREMHDVEWHRRDNVGPKTLAVIRELLHRETRPHEIMQACETI